MARARAVETRLEKLNPSLDEYFTSGFMNREELTAVSRTRTHWEYRLVAKPLLLLDVEDAVQYELGLEEKLRRYCQTSKVQMRHRWTIVERVEYIYKIGLKHLRKREEKERVRHAFVVFLKKYQRHGALSKHYGEMMTMFPTSAAIWVEAALYEAMELKKVDNGRAVLQQALVTMSSEPSVWAAALRVELHFVQRLLDGLLADHREAVQKKRDQAAITAATTPAGATDADAEADPANIAIKLRTENAAMSSILLELALAQAVVEEALASAACSPALLSQMVAVVGDYEFGKPVAQTVVDGAVRRMYDVVYGDSTQKLTTQWKEGAAGTVLRHYLVFNDMIMNGFAHPLIDPESYLLNGPAKERQHAVATASLRAQEENAAASALMTVIAFVAMSEEDRRTVTVGELKSNVANVVADIFADLASRVNPHSAEGVSHVCLALLNGSPLELPQAARWILNSKRLDKKQTEAMVATPQARVAELRALAHKAAAEQPPATKMLRRDREAAADDDKKPLSLPVRTLSKFLTEADLKAIHGDQSSTSCGALTSEALELFLVWWREEDRTGQPAAARLEAAAKLLATHGLISADQQSSLTLLQQLATIVFSNVESSSSSKSSKISNGPLCLWRLYNALEVMEGAADASDAHPLNNDTTVSSSSSSSSDDDDDDNTPTTTAKGKRTELCASYAAAGLRFLAGAPHGSLTKEEEWERISGVHALLRSRLFSWTGLKRVSRQDLLAWMRRSDAARVARCVADIQAVLVPLARCQPVPRLCQSEMVIPFLEAVALFTKDKESLRRARDAHEELIHLYSFTKALDAFLPVQYNGVAKDLAQLKCCRAAAEAANVEDWISYVVFEREVARDLDRARTVTERARRFVLAPQLFLVKLNN